MEFVVISSLNQNKMLNNFKATILIVKNRKICIFFNHPLYQGTLKKIAGSDAF